MLLQDKAPVAELEMRSLPALSATMPMYDILQLFKIGRAHMALLKEASPGAQLPCFVLQILPARCSAYLPVNSVTRS